MPGSGPVCSSPLGSSDPEGPPGSQRHDLYHRVAEDWCGYHRFRRLLHPLWDTAVL
ncbi:unnamed protein product [Gulo gulo]|uniref:Uncharacterized protein n=1 Tax=Gulo gulo TaxID=48420 RepID=A0A9X9MDX9_GULGU|nr:unnamed protein product [Gulo gulo]